MGRGGGRLGELRHVSGVIDRVGEDHAFVKAFALVGAAFIEI